MDIIHYVALLQSHRVLVYSWTLYTTLLCYSHTVCWCTVGHYTIRCSVTVTPCVGVQLDIIHYVALLQSHRVLVYSWTLYTMLLCYSHTVCWCTVGHYTLRCSVTVTPCAGVQLDIIHYVALLQSHHVLVYSWTLYTMLLCYSHTVCWCTVGHYTLCCSVTVTPCVGVQLDIIHYVALLQSHRVLVYSWTLYTMLLCYSHTVCWCTVGHYTVRCSVTVTPCVGVQLDIIHYVALLQSHRVLVYSWTLYTMLLCYSHTVCWCTVGHYTLRCSVTVTPCVGVQLDIIHYVALLQSHRVLVYSWTLYTTLLCYSHTVCWCTVGHYTLCCSVTVTLCAGVQLDIIQYVALLQSHCVLVYSWTLYSTLLCYSHTVCWCTVGHYTVRCSVTVTPCAGVQLDIIQYVALLQSHCVLVYSWTLYSTLLCYSHTVCWCTVGHYTLCCSVTVTLCAGVQLDIIQYVALLQSHRVLVYSWTLYTMLLCYSHTVCWCTVGHYTLRCSVTVTPCVGVQLDIIHYVALLQSHRVLVYSWTLYTMLLCYSHTVCWCTVGHYTVRCSVTVTLCVGVQLDIIQYVALLQSHRVLVYSWTLYTMLLCYSHTVCWCTVGHYTVRCSVTVTPCVGVQLDIIQYVALLQSHCVLVYSWTLYSTLLCYSHTVCWCTVGHYTVRCSVTVTLCVGVQLDIIHYVALLQSHCVLVYSWTLYTMLLCYSHTVCWCTVGHYTLCCSVTVTLCVGVQLDIIHYVALLQSHCVLVYSWTLYTTLLCYSHTVCWCTVGHYTVRCSVTVTLCAGVQLDIIQYVALLQSHCVLVYSWTLYSTLLCYSHTVCWCTVGHYTVRCSVTVTLCVGVQLDIIQYVALLQSHCVLVYSWTLYSTLLCYSHTVCWCTVGHYTVRCSVTVTLCVGVQLDIIHYVALLQSHCVLVYSWTLYSTLLCYSHTVCWCTVGHYTVRCSVTVTLCVGVQLDIIHYVALLQSHRVLVYSWTLYSTLLCYSHTVCWCTVGHYTVRCSVTVTPCVGVQLDIIHYVALLQSHHVLVYSWTLYSTLLCYSHTVCWFTVGHYTVRCSVTVTLCVGVQVDIIHYVALLQSHCVFVYSWTLYTTLLCYSHTVCWCTVGHYTLRCSVTVTPCVGVQVDIIHYVALLQSLCVFVYSWTLYTTLLCCSHTVCWFTVGHYTIRCSVTVTPCVGVQLDIMNH